MRDLLGAFLKALNLERIVSYGHSLGDAAATSLVRADARVHGGVDLDGQLVEPIKTLGLRKQFVLAGRLKQRSEDNTWNEFKPHLLGPRMELAIIGTAHASFTDLPLLLSVIHLSPKVREILKLYLGDVDAKQLEKMSCVPKAVRCIPTYPRWVGR